jgi:uncharacterized membrane protein YagU involved in acid resistance
MRFLRTIAIAGLTAGFLDINAAFIQAGAYGVPPARVLKYVASGALGPEAMNGGVGTAALGLMFHFLIAITAAAIFVAIASRWSWPTQHPWMAALIYGETVFLFMRYVTVPLSLARRPVDTPKSLITGALIHLVCIGLPISLITRRGLAGRSLDVKGKSA